MTNEVRLDLRPVADRARDARAQSGRATSTVELPELPRLAVIRDRRADAGKRTRVIVVEDHAEMRRQLCALLQTLDGVLLVGEADSAEAGLGLTLRQQPDLVLSDISLPDRTGLQLLSDVRRFSPGVRVVMLTVHDDEEHVRAALNAGADGYVLKDSGREVLALAMRTVMAGQRYLCGPVCARVVAGYLDRSEHLPTAAVNLLTAREREVLQLLALGQANKLVAGQLRLSVKTVEKHRANLMRKLGLHSAVGIALFAVFNGLVHANEPLEAAGRR